MESDAYPDFSRGCYLDINVDGVPSVALVDTGATVSVISSQFVNKFTKLQCKLTHGKLNSVAGLGGKRVHVQGELFCELTLGDEINFGPHTLHVLHSELSVPMILGMDFVRGAGIIIDVPNHKLCKQNKDKTITNLPLSIEMQGDSSNLYVLHAENLKPFERRLIPVTLQEKITEEGCIVPFSETGGQLWRVAGSVNVMKSGVTWCEVINTSNRNESLIKGMKVGLWQPTCLVVNTIKTCQDTSELLESLQIEDLPLEPAQKEAIKGVIRKFKDVFSMDEKDLGYCTTVKHLIDVGNNSPVRQRFRRLHPPIKDKVEEELKKMESQGVIEKSISPWCSPLVPVRKKDGRIRICIDYRKLNSITKFNSFPLPNIQDNISQFTGAKFFSTLDLMSGYHQVALEDSSKEKTAFATEGGLYQFKVMPQGACNSPATFQNLMNIVLSGISSRRALAYLDDILVVGTGFEDHLNNLVEVLERLRLHGLKLGIKKCNLFKHEVLYLGHVLTREGIKPAEHNVQAIKDLPVPKTIRQVKRLNGMVNYYSRFVPYIATIMEPLYKITAMKKLMWTSECQTAFEKVKEILCTYPVLGYPRYGSEDNFLLTTDGSGVGIGALLSQIQDGVERPLGYASVSFNKAQHKYTATERELAAVRFGIKHFRPFLFGRKFTIRVDHQALVYLEQMKCVDTRLMRTYEDLQIGEYNIEYIKGSDNIVADFLSRAPLNMELETDDSIDSVEVPDPVHVVPGGPNSLFESLHWATDDQDGSAGELRAEVVEYLLNNLTRYGYENKSRDKKLISSLRQSFVYADHRLVQPYVDLYCCDVVVKYVPGPHVSFVNKNSRSKVTLECKGGIHFNVLSERVEIREKSDGNSDVSGERVLFYIAEDEASDCPLGLSSAAVDHSDPQGLDLSCNNQEDSDKYDALIPELDVNDALRTAREIHSELGHAGRSKTLAVCKKKFRAKGLWKVVARCVKECDVCQRHKGEIRQRHQKEPLFNLKSSTTGETLALDLMDFGNRTKRGHKAVLVGVDAFSKFAYCVPIKNKTSITVARALESVIFAPSIIIPKNVHTDNGPEFRGKPFRDLLSKYNINHTHSIPYRPQSNGLVERLNRTIRSRVATMVDGDYGLWDQVIHKIVVQYNRTIHDETGRTPASFYSAAEEAPVLSEGVIVTREAGKNFKPFTLGDLVLRKIPFYSAQDKHKLAPKYDGPYRVVKCVSQVTYHIQDVLNKKKIQIVHYSQIKIYHGDGYTGRVFRRSPKNTKSVRKSFSDAPPVLPAGVAGEFLVPSPVGYAGALDLERLRNSTKNTNGKSFGNLGEPVESAQRRSVSTPERVSLPPLHINSEDLHGDDESFHGEAIEIPLQLSVSSAGESRSVFGGASLQYENINSNYEGNEVAFHSSGLKVVEREESANIYNRQEAGPSSTKTGNDNPPDTIEGTIEVREPVPPLNVRKRGTANSRLFADVEYLVSDCLRLAKIKTGGGPLTRSQARVLASELEGIDTADTRATCNTQFQASAQIVEEIAERTVPGSEDTVEGSSNSAIGSVTPMLGNRRKISEGIERVDECRGSEEIVRDIITVVKEFNERIDELSMESGMSDQLSKLREDLRECSGRIILSVAEVTEEDKVVSESDGEGSTVESILSVPYSVPSFTYIDDWDLTPEMHEHIELPEIDSVLNLSSSDDTLNRSDASASSRPNSTSKLKECCNVG